MVLVVLISVTITGLVLVMAWSAGVNSQMTSTSIKSDQAQYAAESAVQWAICELEANPGWRPTAPNNTVTVGGWPCTITYSDLGTPVGAVGNPLEFTATAARAGTAAKGTVSATVTGAVAYAPAFVTSSNLTLAESATIQGDVETLGSLTVNGPGGSTMGTATGEVKAAKMYIDNNASKTSTYFKGGTPAGNVSSLAAPSQTVQQIYNTLMAGPTIPVESILDYSVPGKVTLDFTKAGGKTVVVSGSSSYTYDGAVGIKGSGTIVVDGDMNFGGGFPYNAATANINIVTLGNATFTNGPFNVNGSFYVKGNWVQSGAYNMQGTVIVNGTSTIGGTGTINVATPPAFDPRNKPRVTTYYGNLP
jgi:Tfp pilus assembly protein PilX